ncbi:STAS domain-containing protein [Rhizobium sp. CRIBSB]|nr:STAS domain-containing protein [Rhizobium sp. CRIBSB]
MQALSNDRREWFSNIASAIIGGMGGYAMIGQSVINVTSGGRGCLSTFVAGAFLLFLIGVFLSGIFFAGKVAKLFRVTRHADAASGMVTYRVTGQIFFASAESFIHAFDFSDIAQKVVIDVTAAHLWDITAVGALDKIVLKYRKAGMDVDVLGFNEASADMVDRYALHDKDERLAASAALH